MLDGLLHQDKGAVKIDPHDFIPVLVREFCQISVDRDPSVVDQDVDLSEMIYGLLDQDLNLVTFPYIALEGNGLTVELFYFLFYL